MPIDLGTEIAAPLKQSIGMLMALDFVPSRL
jgi:hypothetical protein